MVTATRADLERSFLVTALGVAALPTDSLDDLWRKFLIANTPIAGGGGGGDPVMGGDLSGTASNAQIVAGAVGTAEVSAAIEVTSRKGAASGYAGLDGSSKVAIANIPTGTSSSTVAIGNDSRITGAEQAANKGATSGYAGLDGSGKVPIAQLPTGTSSTTVTVGNDSRFAAAEQTANKGASGGYAPLVGSLLPVANLTAGSMLTVVKSGGVWPGGTASTGVRPTSRTDVVVAWIGADPSPGIVASGTAGMLDNVDLRFITQ